MKKLILALLVGIACGQVFAAEDGRTDESSTGTIEVSLSIVPSIQINTVADIHLNITDRSRDATFSEPFCVTGNSERYTVVAEGSRPNGTFLLENEGGDRLEYEVSYLGDPDRGTFDRLEPGTPSPVYDVFAKESDCEGQTRLGITFLSEALINAGSGLYSGFLTLVVSPV